MIYDKMQKECKYGSYDLDNPGGYRLTKGHRLSSPWYYILNNRKTLLYLDQNGPCKMQYQPPNGILVFKRELGEKQSKWQTWISSPDINGGVPFSNFNSPRLSCDTEGFDLKVNWYPERAVYTLKVPKALVTTEIFMPTDTATVSMKTTIENTGSEPMDFTAVPAVFPYVNIPQMVAWDLPEWYLATRLMKRGKMLTLHGQMNDPGMDMEKDRSVTFNIDFEDEAFVTLDMESYCGNGSFFAPSAVIKDSDFDIPMSKADGDSFGGYQSVWAAKYRFTLEAGQSRTLTQVMTVQDSKAYSEEENLADLIYFDNEAYAQKLSSTRAYYTELFEKRSIKTDNPVYDNFINSFAPLQMCWVGSLDRGWPSSMRGVRDASQDFCGVLPLDTQWTRETILNMLEHQQTDGWMPRQISTVSRSAPHDMRYYCDGGAFLLELVHEYLTFTRDGDILTQELVWLDSDNKATVLEHILCCADYYLDPKNIGEHGLCKIWFGDWWDVMDNIGMDGRGEGTTVTAQMIVNLKNLCDMLRWLTDTGRLNTSYSDLIEKYTLARKGFVEAMHSYAYNKDGFVNGYYNDNGRWLLSDCDPDGEKRVYLVANSWAVISGCLTEEMQASVIQNIEDNCRTELGYNTISRGFPVYVDKAGRIGNGTKPVPYTYNHAQSFYVRALCACGKADLAYEATRYILPIDSELLPPELTGAPPFAIANEYSTSPKALKRAGFQFLSGTVSYVLRTVYNFFFGITPAYDGLIIKPCMPAAFGDCSARFTYLGRSFTLKYTHTESGDKRFILNGRELEAQKDGCSGLSQVFIADTELADENIIEII